MLYSPPAILSVPNTFATQAVSILLVESLSFSLYAKFRQVEVQSEKKVIVWATHSGGKSKLKRKHSAVFKNAVFDNAVFDSAVFDLTWFVSCLKLSKNKFHS